VPVTDTWREELKELCLKAGLVDDPPQKSVEAQNANKPAPVRKTVYSGTFAKVSL